MTILRPGFARIMRLFYNKQDAALHLREVARQSGMHTPSVTRFLDALEKEQVLRVYKDGNLKKYSIKKSKQAYLALAAFDVEKYLKLPDIRKNAIQVYLNALPEHPVFAILFGSTAKESYQKESDIDILIITNKQVATKSAEREADALTAMSINTFQMTYDSFIKELKLKKDMVVQSATTTGYPLLNHVRYYEVLYSERI
jgi:predicted nucleotidyltransferase